MNRYYDAKLGMFKAVKAFSVDNESQIIMMNIPIITTYLGQFTSLIEPIQNTSELTKKPTHGITATKAQAREVVVGIAVNVAKILYNYADDHTRPDPSRPPTTDNPPNEDMERLRDDMLKLKGAFLYSVSDENIIDYLENILNEAASIVENLTPPAVNPLLMYGLKEDVGEIEAETYEPGTLTQLQAAIDAYSNLSVSPRTAIDNRKNQNKKLRELSRDADTILSKLDDSFELIKNINSELYEEYQNARKIVGPMTMRTQIVGMVSKVTNIELQTTAIVHGAKITVTASPYTSFKDGQMITVTPNSIITQTDSNGKYAVRTPDIYSTYTVKCTLSGYQTIIKNDILLKKGKKTHVEFLMLPEQQQ